MTDRHTIHVDWDAVAAAARLGGPPTPDDVTIMSDGRRIVTVADMLELLAELDDAGALSTPA